MIVSVLEKFLGDSNVIYIFLDSVGATIVKTLIERIKRIFNKPTSSLDKGSRTFVVQVMA